MKKLFISVASLYLLGILNIHAAQTNLVQSLRFNLSVYLQGTSVTNGSFIDYSIAPGKISTADIIQAIGTSLSKTFSPSAALETVTQLPSGADAIVIQDGTSRVDVSGFFIINKDSIAVAKGSLDTATGWDRGLEYVNRSFRLKNMAAFPSLTLNFRVNGLSPTKYRSLFDDQGSVIGTAEEYVLSVVGTAQVNGADAIAHGSVASTGRRIEIVP